jgi:predicted metal-dependent enzyme (double-stranded beta helix superfamily)
MRPEIIERLIAECRAAAGAGDAQAAVRELVAAAVSEPAAVASALGDPEHAGVDTLYRTPNLTVIHFTWAPWMPFKPHNHNMWAVIGIFVGREDNVFWRRAGERIEAVGARSLGVRDVTVLGPDVIHSVTNPVGKMTRAIHVYGGDFFAPARPRSEWDPETLVERPWDLADTERRFADAEAMYRAVSSDPPA